MIDSIALTKRRQRIRGHSTAPIVLTAYDAVQLSADMAAPFRQQSAFLWMTGITEPGWRYLSLGDNEYLIAPVLTKTQQLFDGGLSHEEARAWSGIEQVISWKQAIILLKQAAVQSNRVLTLGTDPHRAYYSFALNPAQARLRRQLGRMFKTIDSCWPEIKKQMALKDPVAIRATEQAIAASVASFKNVQKGLREGRYRYEYEIEADILHGFRTAGTDGQAYETIVASELNACTLHYVANTQELPENGLVLIDAGAMVDGYAADITRTYAVGTPTDRQRAVHAAVETAHKAILALLKPGLSFAAYLSEVDQIMKQSLDSIGLLKTDSDYHRYFPHAISHGLGLDVHESLGGHEALKPGMILTVEPGIYIPEEKIGVRIEDDILITEDGHRNLSGALPTGL
jgi:Xaa-Pro aminopeptidase